MVALAIFGIFGARLYSTTTVPVSVLPSKVNMENWATTSSASDIDAATDLATAATKSNPSWPKTLTDGKPLPKLLVFDLDYTLWPFWSDTHPSPPLKAKNSNRAAQDRFGQSLAFYKDVPGVIDAAHNKGLKMAIASRTSAIELARDLLRMIHIGHDSGTPTRPARDYFDSVQIYPGDKVRHLRKIQKDTGIDYSQMVFFDDEHRNANTERELGVSFCLVKDGVTKSEIDRGINDWRRKSKSKPKS